MNQEFAQAIEGFIGYIGQRHPTSTTATHYRSDLEQFAQGMEKRPREITSVDVSQFVTEQRERGLSAATVNRRLASLSHFFEYVADEAEAEDWPNPVVMRKHRVSQGQHLPRDLPEGVARPFWQAVCEGPVRDQALVGLMLDVGLRVGEVAALRVSDYEPTVGVGALAALRVRGKGNKERRVWLVPETAALVESWLAERPAVADEALFITRRRRGFSVRGIQDRVKHYARRAGLGVDQVSCHRLRHTFARRMAEERMPLPSLSHWLGHAQLKTTQVYIDGANPDVRADYQAAMDRLSQTAECPHRQTVPNAETMMSSVAEAASAAEPAPAGLTATEIEDRLSGWPAWLVQPSVDFLLAQQARWQAHQRRKRALSWLSALRRAWTWLLAERQITGFADLQRRHLSAYVAHLQARELASSTINNCLTTFWSFLRFVEDQGQPVAAGVFRVPRPQQPAWQPRPLSEGEYARLEQALEQATADAAATASLDRSWFFILSDGGLRISELCMLTVSDWDPHAQTVFVRFGKNGRQRRVPLSDRAAQAIQSHLADRSATPQDALLMRKGRPIRARYVRQRLHALADQAQVSGVTPHRLRHTYATRLLNTGGLSITTLKQLMGHRHIDTTLRYTAIYDQTLQADYEAAMARLFARSEASPDWALWGPAVEGAFQNQPDTAEDAQPNHVTN